MDTKLDHVCVFGWCVAIFCALEHTEAERAHRNPADAATNCRYFATMDRVSHEAAAVADLAHRRQRDRH